MRNAAGGRTPSGGAAPGRDARRRRLLVGVAALVLVLAAVAAVLIFAAPRSSLPAAGPGTSSPTSTPSRTATATPTPAPAKTQPAPLPPSLPGLPPAPMNVLVMGSDIRGNAREATQRQAATGEIVDQRADMIMLIHIPADRHRLYGISIMRDNWVAIPGHGASKINSSLSLGGPQLVADTVGSLLDTHIDHYVLTDFDGFKALTDALGGIEVNVTLPFTASFDTHHTFTQGINRLDGQAALEFVRERYSFIDGDYQRVRNQQAFVRAIMARLLGTGTVRDPANAIHIIGVLSPYLTVDPGFDQTGMAALAFALRGTDPAASVFFTLPTAGTGFSADGQSIVIPDYRGISEVAAALAADGLAGYAAAHGL